MIKAKHEIIIQSILIALVALIAGYFYYNVSQHLIQDHIASGFGFLQEEAGFDIVMHLISFSPSSTYLRAFYVGILNTLLLSFFAIIFSSIIGLSVALARLSRNWLIARLGTLYVEVLRNMPLLLQVLFWYFVLLKYLPQDNASINLFGFIHINLRGIVIGNITIIPELSAMLLALSLYSACYIAETIRSGILSIDKGQLEAAAVSGLKRQHIVRLIILPQASKVIIPPLINQYSNTIKNSSLGSAVGYPDLVAVFAGTVLNQTGQAIETIFMTMCFYLVVSLIISYLMNLYNRKVVAIGK